MTNYDAYDELVRKVDNLIAFSLDYGFRKVEQRNDYEGFFAGATDAAYIFAYGIVDNECATVKDAIDNMWDDIAWYEDDRHNAYRKGYVYKAKDILKALRRFKDSYEDSCETPIKHVYSVMTLEDFARV